MIAVDTNLLVYAHRRDSPWFEPARKAVRSLVEGTATWSIPWPCLHEFLAITTHPKIYNPPTELPRADAVTHAGGRGVPVYVIDPNGFVILRYAAGSDPGDLRSDLAKLLKLK